MKFKHLLLLIVCSLVLFYFATNYSGKRAPSTTIEKTLLFPDLSNQINQVKIVEIKGYEQHVILSHLNNEWVIQSSDNFPAKTEQVKSLIIGLSELKIDSEKTKNPELYARLAVEGPYDRVTKSKLVSLLDESGEVLVTLIIGKKRENNQAIPALYVRKPDMEQALLVQGNIDVSSREQDWFENEIINLESAEVRKVSVTHPNQSTYTLLREQEGQVNFTLDKIPEGKKPQSEIILNRMGRLLEDVRAESVRSIDTVDLSDNAVIATVESFRGLVVNIRLKEISSKYYANFQFEYIPPENSNTQENQENIPQDALTPEQEIQLLNSKVSPWVFEIPKFKYDDMTTGFDKLVRN